MVWEQEEVCNHGIDSGREATFFYCRTSGIASFMREEEFFFHRRDALVLQVFQRGS